jgi:HlyD family secretion protein
VGSAPDQPAASPFGPSCLCGLRFRSARRKIISRTRLDPRIVRTVNLEHSALDGLRIERRALPRRETPKWIPTALVAGVLALGFTAWRLSLPKAIVVQTVSVAAESAAGGAGKTLLNASGYVTARREATVSSKVTGKVMEMLVEEGMKVEPEQVLARLDASNVQASLHLSEAQLESAKKAVDETQPNLDFARRELKRFTDLAKTKVVSDSDLRRSEMTALGLEAKLAHQIADVSVAEGVVAQWKQELDDTIIRAPFGGIVTSKNAQAGEMISPMSVGGFTRTGICTVVDMSSLEIDVDVSESYIHRVQPGQPVEAVLDAYPDWRIPSKVIAIIPSADRQKATVKVRVGFVQLDPRILPDMGVKVAFQSAEPAKARPDGDRTVAAPTAAVQRVDGRDIVWVAHEVRAERRAVTVAGIRGDQSLIAAGLASGEKIVLHPPKELTEGSRITENEP